MDVQQVIAQGRDSMTVSRVYGEAYERDGATVIPAAIVRGAAGGGSGEREEHEHGEQEGEGGGFTLSVRPAGALVIRGDKVIWRPAVDVNRIIMGGQIVAVVALLVVPRMVHAARRALPTTPATGGVRWRLPRRA